MIGEILVGIVIFGFVGIILVCLMCDVLRCKHEWEEVISNSNTVVYRCKKCGKEKRYTL